MYLLEELWPNYIALFIILEIYEVQWQRAKTILGMLARMFQHYHKSIFLFLLMHPTFYFAIALMILSDFNGYAVTLFAIKAVDIGTKITLIKKVFIDKEMDEQLSIALLTPLNGVLPYVGVFLYPVLIYFVFNAGI